MKRRVLYSVLFILSVLRIGAQEPVAVPDSTQTPASSTCSISGRVVDEEQKPLPFVTVKVEGQVAGSVTGFDGKYSFDFQSADSVVLNYSLIGYEKKQKVLVRPQGKLTWNVTMRSSGTEMGEVVVSE
ncbi:MAG: carboxypeptidase-like regulatory domain-containing protein, partial [Prevotella sp.]|nr:carboxypeptidase-like regulatory domain-containing protein [Prevotella sp.]